MFKDDGLACFENVCGPQAEKVREDVFKIFKQEFDLNITSERNLKTVNFSDVTLNLSTGKYQPYNKPDNDPLYIDVNFNHPTKITKNLPASISKQINKLSFDEHIFNNTTQTEILYTSCIQKLYKMYATDVYKMYTTFQQTFVYILYTKLKRQSSVYILYTKLKQL